MESGFAALGAAIGTVAFFGFCAFAVWVDYRKKRDERQTTHEERLKALELGQVLPDGEIARATAEVTRARAAGLIGALVPTVVTLIAGIVSGFILNLPEPSRWEGMHPKAQDLLVVWAACMPILLVTPIVALAMLRRRPSAPEAKPTPRVERGSEAFTERAPSL
jgi:hypothetical protein